MTALIAGVALVGSAVAVMPAAADPDGSGDDSAITSTTTEPHSVAEAKQAWLDASEQSESAGQALLEAKQKQQQAERDVTATKVQVALAELAASSARGAVIPAKAHYDQLRTKIAEFASASFRGGRLGHLGALLTADSSADYLDEMSSLNQVADSTQELIEEALAARRQAEDAATKADATEQNAAQAQSAAVAALDAAKQATKEVAASKAAFDDQADHYHELYSELSAEQRHEAMAAQRRQWQQQAEAAAEQQARTLAASAADGAGAAADSNDSDGHVGGDEPATGKAEVAVQAALSKIGLPYVWGATGPNGFDCSGLTSWAWAQAGVTLPRTSRAQSHLPQVPLDQLRPGDLVTYYSPVHHVAMYIGNGKIVEASTEGQPIAISSVLRGGPFPTGHRVSY